MEDNIDLLMEAILDPPFHSHFPVRDGHVTKLWLERHKHNCTGCHISTPPPQHWLPHQDMCSMREAGAAILRQ